MAAVSLFPVRNKDTPKDSQHWRSTRIYYNPQQHHTCSCQSDSTVSWRYVILIPLRTYTHGDAHWFPYGLHCLYCPLSFLNYTEKLIARRKQLRGTSGLSKVASYRRKSPPTWLKSASYSAWHFFMDGVF